MSGSGIIGDVGSHSGVIGPKPLFLVKGMAALVTLNGGGWTAVTNWNAPTVETVECFSGTNFTPPRTGQYYISWKFTCYGLTEDDAIYCKINDASIGDILVQEFKGDLATFSSNLAGVVSLTKGLGVRCMQYNYNTSVATRGTLHNNGNYTTFSAYLID